MEWGRRPSSRQAPRDRVEEGVRARNPPLRRRRRRGRHPDSAPGPDFSYSAYLLWDEMPQHHDQWPVAGWNHADRAGRHAQELDQVLADYLDARRDEAAPRAGPDLEVHQGLPVPGRASRSKKVERATFDVATSVVRHPRRTASVSNGSPSVCSRTRCSRGRAT